MSSISSFQDILDVFATGSGATSPPRSYCTGADLIIRGGNNHAVAKISLPGLLALPKTPPIRGE